MGTKIAVDNNTGDSNGNKKPPEIITTEAPTSVDQRQQHRLVSESTYGAIEMPAKEADAKIMSEDKWAAARRSTVTETLNQACKQLKDYKDRQESARNGALLLIILRLLNLVITFTIPTNAFQINGFIYLYLFTR